MYWPDIYICQVDKRREIGNTSSYSYELCPLCYGVPVIKTKAQRILQGYAQRLFRHWFCPVYIAAAECCIEFCDGYKRPVGRNEILIFGPGPVLQCRALGHRSVYVRLPRRRQLVFEENVSFFFWRNYTFKPSSLREDRVYLFLFSSCAGNFNRSACESLKQGFLARNFDTCTTTPIALKRMSIVLLAIKLELKTYLNFYILTYGRWGF